MYLNSGAERKMSMCDTCGRVRDQDAHDQAYPHNRLRLLELEAPGVKCGCARHKYAQPAQRKAYISVEMDLFKKVGSREELDGIIRR